jgi:hypothetical protein
MVFFRGPESVRVGQRLPCAPPFGGMRRGLVQPSPLRAGRPHDPQGLPLRVAAWQTLRPRPGGPAWLTASARSVHSATDSGGRKKAAAFLRQTGNSGANPGRPRRCVRAIFESGQPQARERGRSHSSHCRHGTLSGTAGAARRRAIARARESEDLPGVWSLPDREGGMAGTAAAAAGRDALQGSAPARTCVPGVAPCLFEGSEPAAGEGALAAGHSAWISQPAAAAA